MKKPFFLLIFFATIVLSSLSSEEKIIDGYNNLKWGSSIEEVNLIYTAEEIKYSQHGVRKFTRKESNISQNFFFFEDKLFKVGIAYDDIDFTFMKSLTQNLVDKYGKFDNLTEAINNIDNKTYAEKVYLDRFFSTNFAIRLTLIDISNQANNTLVASECYITYYEPAIEAEVEKKAIEKL